MCDNIKKKFRVKIILNKIIKEIIYHEKNNDSSCYCCSDGYFNFKLCCN